VTTPELPADGRPSPSAAPVCRLRLRFAKGGRLRFASHRDVARCFARALRRADVPMAHSQGFTPHPKISWHGAAPTGTASEAEYVELALVADLDAATLRERLTAALPSGLEVTDAVRAETGTLGERIQASHWSIELPGIPVEALSGAAAALREADRIDVQRLTKAGRRTVDVRAAIVSVDVSAAVHQPIDGDHRAGRSAVPGFPPECGTLEVVVREGTPTVRPDDVCSAPRAVVGLAPTGSARATRRAQGRLDDTGDLVDPLEPDRGIPERDGWRDAVRENGTRVDTSSDDAS
jgi:radical SAM-linked protein